MMTIKNSQNIGIIGCGYVGAITGTFMADKAKQHQFYVTDLDDHKIAAYGAGRCYIHEPGLHEILSRTFGACYDRQEISESMIKNSLINRRNLFFVHNKDKQWLINNCGVLIFALPTYTLKEGPGEGMVPDISALKECARDVARYAKESKVIVIKSTVSLDTGKMLEEQLEQESPIKHYVISSPEFLAEGCAVSDLESHIAVIGSNYEDKSIADCMADVYRAWLPPEKVIIAHREAAILGKLMNNACLASQINHMASVQQLFESLSWMGGDVDEIAAIVGGDRRQGRFNKAGRAWGGSCFRKDILDLVYCFRKYGFPDLADYWLKEVAINDYNEHRLANMVIKHLAKITGAKKRVAVLGYTFKPETDDPRNTPVTTLLSRLAEQRGIEVVITDPQALENVKKIHAEDEKKHPGIHKNVIIEEDPMNAALSADIILLHTDWQHYLMDKLDYQQIMAAHSAAQRKATIIDAWRCLDGNALFSMGFDYVPLGAKAQIH